jgi:hypothetical protein
VRLTRRPLVSAVAAALLLAGGPSARGAQELPKYGVISRPKGFSTIRLVAAPGLAVFLDGKPAGTTDVLQQGLVIEDLPAGTYSLRVEKPGFEPKVVKVAVAEGDTKEVRVLGLRPAATPTPAPPARTPLAGGAPAPAPAPVRAVILERKHVADGTVVVGVASGAVDALPIVEGLKAECGCTPTLEALTRRKDGLYEFRVKLPRK